MAWRFDYKYALTVVFISLLASTPNETLSKRQTMKGNAYLCVIWNG